ncbi:hypothetical protein M422DRAFT_54921 [Sphaerobolus stellatus SS14]|uniref:Alpha-type protein kinase domain-containing protein n=1 Tax=Sphaerobolus stellatus (strain SS14) TaxID=990650 RepID=A0A0C9U117_SPHS4|nr:hypothetical protein M422DRAFT_54921 [Sphaerobolus stellatus SS14]
MEEENGSEHVNKLAIWWLIEPLWNTVVRKWSSTKHWPEAIGLAEYTVAAFHHFTYKWSKETLVLADVQSSQGKLSNGRPGQIFFDHQTHTPDGDSGIGDFGQEGIDAFIEKHTCTPMCIELGLAVEEEGADEENETEDEDNAEELRQTRSQGSRGKGTQGTRRSARLYI